MRYGIREGGGEAEGGEGEGVERTGGRERGGRGSGEGGEREGWQWEGSTRLCVCCRMISRISALSASTPWTPSLRVHLGYRVSGFGLSGFGSGVSGRVWISEFRVQGSGFRVSG
jgi:hypothetical protein